MSVARLLVIAALAGCAKAPVTEPPASPVPQEEASPMDAIHGTWRYRYDPAGDLPHEPLYDGATITFGADGSFELQLANTSFALEGTWRLLGAEGDRVRLRTDYGEGRVIDRVLTLRRGATGRVDAFVFADADDATGPYLFERAPAE